MIYLYKSDLTRAKEMNQKCREAGVIALDCEGNDSDMYGWPDTFYLYFPTEESIKLFNDLSNYLHIERTGFCILSITIAACFVFRLTIMQPSLRLLRKTIIEKKRNSL
jgi:hypothetical protein